MMKYRVSVFLSCAHLSFRDVDNPAFLPRKGDKTNCDQCGKEVEIRIVGKPYRVRIEEKIPTRQ
jgi:predicted metalloprotease